MSRDFPGEAGRDRLRSALEQALAEGRRHVNRGKVAAYIPPLARADPDALGAAIALPGGEVVAAGDCRHPFTLQSVSKVFSLLLALERLGPGAVFSRVGMEPTGDPFNSVLRLELAESPRPLNPMINAGAVAVCGLLVEQLGPGSFGELVELVRAAAQSGSVDVDEEVYLAEKETGHRNRALAYFLKDLGVLRAGVEETLDYYFRQCALRVTCVDLARMGLFLAAPPGSPAPVCRELIRMVNAFMVTCGMYNGSGEFAVRAGIPAKSGVSGAVMAVVPGRLGVGVYGPALESRGNSVGGVELLVALSRRLDWSVF